MIEQELAQQEFLQAAKKLARKLLDEQLRPAHTESIAYWRPFAAGGGVAAEPFGIVV
jgi:hypothetical protein